MIPIEDWQEKSGFLSFYHMNHALHGTPFPDSLDTTAIWLTQEFINGYKSALQIRAILVEGIYSRAKDGKVYRTSERREEIGKDQLDFLIPLMYAVDMVYMADVLVDQYGDKSLPHRRDHLEGKSTFFGRVFECFDSVVDWFSNSKPSQMNNLARLIWASYNGRKNKLAIKLFRMKLDPYRIFVIYGAREPWQDAGKKGKEREAVHDKIYKDATENGATVNDPPPIYRGYAEICEKYL